MNEQYNKIVDNFIIPRIRDAFYKLYDELNIECAKQEVLHPVKKMNLNRVFRSEWKTVVAKEDSRLQDLENRGIDWLECLSDKKE